MGHHYDRDAQAFLDAASRVYLASEDSRWAKLISGADLDTRATVERILLARVELALRLAHPKQSAARFLRVAKERAGDSFTGLFDRAFAASIYALAARRDLPDQAMAPVLPVLGHSVVGDIIPFAPAPDMMPGMLPPLLHRALYQRQENVDE